MGINAITMGAWASASAHSSASLWGPSEIANLLYNGDSYTAYLGYASALNNQILLSNSNFVQSTSSYRPAINSSNLNGHDTFTFDGSDDWMLTESGALSIFNNVSKAWIFAVFKINYLDASITERGLCNVSTPTTTTRVGLNISGSSSTKNRVVIGGRRLDSSTYSGIVSSIDNTTTWVMALGYNDYIARTIALYKNGALENQLTSAFDAAGNTSTTNSARITLARSAYSSPTGLGSFTLAEVALGNGALTVEYIDKLFGYAAHRYGLTANLASDHPYKTVAPTG